MEKYFKNLLSGVKKHKKTLLAVVVTAAAAALALAFIVPAASKYLGKTGVSDPQAAEPAEAVIEVNAHSEEPDRTAAPLEPAAPTPSVPQPTAWPMPQTTRNPLLQPGQLNDFVASLQDRLMELGYLDIDEPTRYYGSATANAVEIFQRQHELYMDGYAGQETLSLLFSPDAQKYVMKLDTKGLDVENLQTQLEFLGYYEKEIDGYYGEATQDAVKAFQSRNGLNADGLAGEETIDKLFSPDAVPASHIARERQRQANIQTFINTAYGQLGKKYVLGACGPNRFDCSGLVYYCLRKAGSSIGRYNAAGYSSVSYWKKIKNIDNLQIGDLMFFYNKTYSKVGHVGIYVGNGMMIDASASNGKVVLRPCRTYYWRKHFACARRPWQ